MRAGIVEQRHGRACSGGERCRCPWRFRVDGPEGLDGKRRQITDGGFPTKTAAREALAEMQRKIANGEVVGKSDTVEAYLTRWLAAKASVLKPATISQYRDLSDRFLIPKLGRIKLTELRAAHIEGMLASMEAEATAKAEAKKARAEAEGRTLVEAKDPGLVTRRRTVAVLSSALASAVKRRLVTWNVCTQLELPTERAERRPVWDVAETARFLAHVDSDRLAALWRLYAISGLRRGEALALRWSNVDLETGSLRVERTLGEIGGRLIMGAPKTVNGRRTIALDARSVSGLRSHRARQSAERLALGAGYDDSDLVFAREDGHAIWPGTVSARLRVLTAEAGLSLIRLHDLRHTAASLALAGGVDLKTVSANLGHSGIAITADLYAHVLPATARAAAEKVAQLVDAER